MANKNKRPNPEETKNYIDLLYMTPSEVSAKDIATLLQETYGVSFELWEQMNVLEVTLPNQNSMDFEPLDIRLKNPSDLSFVKNRNIKTIFVINLCTEDIDLVTSYFEQIADKFSGFLCADSEDFYPVYVGSTKK